MNELETEMGDEVDFKMIDTSRDISEARKYGVQTIPTVIVVDGSGNVVFSRIGFSNENEYGQALRQALGEVTS